MKSLIKGLWVLTVGVSLILCANSLIAGPAVDDFSVNTVGSVWVDLSSNKPNASFKIENGIATLSYAQSSDGYAYVLAWLWFDTNNYSGIKIDVTSLAAGCLWGFRMDLVYPGGDSIVYTGKGTGKVFIPYPQDVAYMGGNVPVLCMLVLANPGSASPSISLDSISLADPWEDDLAGVGMTPEQEAKLNSVDTAINGVDGILDRLDAIEKALSKPGASGVARWGK